MVCNGKLLVEKVWAQLTNPRDQLSHQIGYPFFFFFFACPSHQIGYPFSFSFFACHFFPLSFTMSQQRVCNLIRLIFPAESRRAQKQLQPVSTGYNDWKENVQRPLSDIPPKKKQIFFLKILLQAFTLTTSATSRATTTSQVSSGSNAWKRKAPLSHGL